jgi:hypothetical protein
MQGTRERINFCSWDQTVPQVRSTEPQVRALFQANVPAVIATSEAIFDNVSARFARRFYQSLANGAELYAAFREAEGDILSEPGKNLRDLYIDGPPPTQDFPWKWHIRPGAEAVSTWSLPKAVDNPLFGLPPVPVRDLPDTPYRHLNSFDPEHSEVFFGRGHQIRDLYQRIIASDTDPIILFFGQSGVVKSSILAAGVLPRLQGSHEVRYYRPNQQAGLLGTIRTEGTSLKDGWIALEATSKRPVVVFLDQVEEAFTRPRPVRPKEVEDFMDMVHEVFADSRRRPKGNWFSASEKSSSRIMDRKRCGTESNPILSGSEFVCRLSIAPWHVPSHFSCFSLKAAIFDASDCKATVYGLAAVD